MSAPQPHDLLRLAAFALPTDAPAWAVRALRGAPWVVVRRATAPTGLIAVGVRGTARSERYGTAVSLDDVREVVPPEELAHVASRRQLPALRTLGTVAPLLDDTGLAWGPTGSVGFELATGMEAATAESDLDLLIRMPGFDVRPLLTKMHQGLQSHAARLDCQIEIPTGAIALVELMGSQPDIMVRTADGPRLVARAVAVS